MDYLEIVFNGFANPNNREHLVNYFFREFKKAEKEHFEANEFFTGCIKVIQALESEMDKRLYERKNELSLMQGRAENGDTKFAVNDDTKTFEQRCKETVEYCENELAQISRYNFPVNLLHFTSNKYSGNFAESDAILIRDAISKAKNKATPIGNLTIDFINIYNKEVTPERKEHLNIRLAEIESIPNKIQYLENESTEYLKNLSAEAFYISGTTSFPNFEKGTPILWDRYLKEQIEDLKRTQNPQQTETRTDRLKAEIVKYGFLELSKIKQLSEPNIQTLIEKISTNGLPYSIAMFDYLGFLSHLKNAHFKTKGELNKEVAKWFNSDKEGRAVKGNISSLSEYSKENKNKYTAHTHKEIVKIDYQNLK